MYATAKYESLAAVSQVVRCSNPDVGFLSGPRTGLPAAGEEGVSGVPAKIGQFLPGPC
jgi:hypothetical protein